MVKIGIDFGKTIADLMSEKIEIEFSIEAINKLVNRFGNNNIWIVSKAGDEMEKKIKKWLLDNKFNTRTGFINSQIIFANKFADYTVYVSDWLHDLFKSKKLTSVKSKVIKSGSDSNIFNQSDKSQTQGILDGFDELTAIDRLEYSYVVWEDALGNHLDRYYPVTSATETASSTSQCTCESLSMRFLFSSSSTKGCIFFTLDPVMDKSPVLTSVTRQSTSFPSSQNSTLPLSA